MSKQSFAGFEFATKAVRSGLSHDTTTGAISEHICLSTTFAQKDINEPFGQYCYSRSNNPNRESLQVTIAALEGASYSLAFSSGLAATTAVLQTLATNGHVITMMDIYSGTARYFNKLGQTHGLSVSYVSDLEGDLVEALKIREDTRLIWIESPSNPTLTLVDIKQVVEIAHQRGVLVLVDNTFLSPYIQNPLALGADLVLHSVTKYINGHSLSTHLNYLRSCLFPKCSRERSESFRLLAHRGIKTMYLRVKAANDNASTIASLLKESPLVLQVNYPGLSGKLQPELVLRQHRLGMGGGMISFRIRGGAKAAEAFSKASKLFTLAESLGGVESLCEIPARMTHGLSREARQAAGVFDDMIRLSVGIEGIEDLKKDVLSALEEACTS
ncbi:hypothetical protein TWF191_010202 [Orbilia oligospora]|uniref:cystathionine gamma-lyase n=1 Tax=Orbilia oligospora TaxID=2813651 RepID=A0A7C8R107_ORBOL|nr:hypothetical protein TWF679_005408 [Orbilia oligospora]KAF3230316.1 hypothetical protein TWF191_010202 [Orbilia oligospora]